MSDNTEKEKSPPYMSFKTLTNFLQSTKESGLPARIDKSLMNGHSGATQTLLMNTLQFFDFIDEHGTPLKNFIDWTDGLRSGPEIMAQAVRQHYGFLFNGDFDMKRGTLAQLDEAFREQGLNGSTIRKAVTFFVGATDYSKIEISSHFKVKRGGGGSSKPRAPRKKAAQKLDSDTEQEPPPPPTGFAHSMLPLNSDGSRYIKVEGPRTVTGQELKRIKGWLQFQFIVEDGEEPELDDNDEF